MQMASRSILFYSILFCSKILQMMMFGFVGRKKKFKLLCVLTLFTAEVKHCMVQHQHGLQMKQRKMKLAAVFSLLRGRCVVVNIVPIGGKTTMLMHLIIMASSFITALNQLFCPLLSQQQGNFSYQDPQHLYLFSVFAQTQMTQWQSLVLGTESFSTHPVLSVTSKIWTKQFLVMAEVKFWKINFWRSRANSFCLQISILKTKLLQEQW